MTTRDALHEATTSLVPAEVETPRLDAILILAHTLKKTKEFILAHPEHKLTTAHVRRFFAFIKRRAEREPCAYITGHKEFYGLDFLVNHHTLIPRPETETIIEAVRKELPVTIVDVGTGSGAIAVTLARLLPRATVYATDISNAALRIARKNAKRHGVRVHFKKGNLLQPLLHQPINQSTGQLFIVANLPYLKTATWRAAQPEVKRYEPRTALDGGPDGLKYYRQLLAQIKKLPVTSYSPTSERNPEFTLRLPSEAGEQRAKRSYKLRVTLYFEIDPRETIPLATLIHKIFPNVRITIKHDLANRARIFVAKL